MIIIETCPVCGADIYDCVIATYPSITIKRCTKCDWSWREEPDDVVRVPFVPPGQKREQVTWPRHDWNDGESEWMFGWIPDCCRGCSNHPSNGGSGICCCTLPDMERSRTAPKGRSYTYTYTVDTRTTIGENPDTIVSDHT